mmetsp:Transcript_28117/g.80801  ORF Transcript_28117/g.80801 Transcript_28117/m.80801 type:complete len:219 (-) Transcript_28117:711-1367(-)
MSFGAHPGNVVLATLISAGGAASTVVGAGAATDAVRFAVGRGLVGANRFRIRTAAGALRRRCLHIGTARDQNLREPLEKILWSYPLAMQRSLDLFEAWNLSSSTRTTRTCPSTLQLVLCAAATAPAAPAAPSKTSECLSSLIHVVRPACVLGVIALLLCVVLLWACIVQRCRDVDLSAVGAMRLCACWRAPPADPAFLLQLCHRGKVGLDVIRSALQQ